LLLNLKDKFFLGWWTAIALQLWHRKSIDFDLFTFDDTLPLNFIIKNENKFNSQKTLLFETSEQRDILMNDVKISYIVYPFNVWNNFLEDKFLKIPDLLTLAVMKAYAIWRRAKWKDYVDLYFLINKFWIENIIKKAKQIYGGDFSEKLFIRQLWYFDDIDYSEQIEWIKWFEFSDKKIKNTLKNISLSYIL
jgi:hypothetical protein